MKKIHGFLFTISMVLGFITLVIMVNLNVLDPENISIMFWGMGFIALWYALLWIVFIKIVLAIFNKLKDKFL